MVSVIGPVAWASTRSTCHIPPTRACKSWGPDLSSRSFGMLVLETATKAKTTTTAGKMTAARTTTAAGTTIAPKTTTAPRTTIAGHLTHLARDLDAGLSWAPCLAVGGRPSGITESETQLSNTAVKAMTVEPSSAPYIPSRSSGNT